MPRGGATRRGGDPRLRGSGLTSVLDTLGGTPAPAEATGPPLLLTPSGPVPVSGQLGCFQRMKDLPVGSSQGWDALMHGCATLDGDVAATCSLMRATALPATMMLQHEAFF